MWLCGAAVLVASIVYYDELKGFFGQGMIAVSQSQSQPFKRSPHQQPPQPTRTISSPGSVELAAGPNGHFFAEAEINGRRIPVMVDTGASLVALSHEDAQRAGVYVTAGDFKYTVSTANGPARIAVVNLDRVSIGSITVYNVRAAVGERGALRTTLLGMSFLGKLRRAEMRQGRLILEN
ncbi:MAG: TIGR02281 family clan AA aspartic protease [Hyphomicrobiaceae bacterium]|nr:TIGR02281 family clan AA aspartic protease [Hyphomicrobiaceae bacterium]